MNTLKKESRELPESRAANSIPEANGNKLVGLAIPYNSPSQPIIEKGKTFIEIISPGAFATSLKTGRSTIENRPISFVYRHDDMAEYGSTDSNLTLHEDEKGIHFVLELPEYAVHLKEAVASGQIRDMSFEFYCIKDRWEGNVRYVEQADLVHVSAVMKGAYPEASVEIRQDNKLWKYKNDILRKKLMILSK